MTCANTVKVPVRIDSSQNLIPPLILQNNKQYNAFIHLIVLSIWYCIDYCKYLLLSSLHFLFQVSKGTNQHETVQQGLFFTILTEPNMAPKVECSLFFAHSAVNSLESFENFNNILALNNEKLVSTVALAILTNAIPYYV